MDRPSQLGESNCRFGDGRWKGGRNELWIGPCRTMFLSCRYFLVFQFFYYGPHASRPSTHWQFVSNWGNECAFPWTLASSTNNRHHSLLLTIFPPSSPPSPPRSWLAVNWIAIQVWVTRKAKVFALKSCFLTKPLKLYELLSLAHLIFFFSWA